MSDVANQSWTREQPNINEMAWKIRRGKSAVVSRIQVYVHLVYVHMYAAYDTRCPIATFSLLLVYVWLFTCIRLRFVTSDVRSATAIFSLWDQKNRMTSEFR